MAAARDILLDVSRLVWRGSTARLPTGIDRVCLAYVARYRDRAQAVVQWRGHRRMLSAAASTALFDAVLGGRNVGGRMAAHVPALLRDLANRQEGAGRPYLNIGHTGLDRRGVGAWARRVRVRPIYMVHDLIPITHPEYARAGEAARHAARMTTVLETGAGIITNSQATLDALTAWAGAHDLPRPPAMVAWLGTETLPDDHGRPPLDDPYFVTLGTIEGRKNHLLLLQLWRDLAERGAGPIPRLVVIGQRGWAAEQSLALLDRCGALSGHVIERSRCDDGELARYLRHARALLFPSFAEGYGMPLAETLALGVPAIVSDLAVFRELAGDIPLYLDPGDQRAWRDAILDHASPGSAERAHRQSLSRHYRPPGWSEHFDHVERWMATL